MEVIRKQLDSCSFNDINIGDCFTIDTDIDAVFMSAVEGNKANAAVDLTDGRIMWFSPTDKVTPVHIKAVLE